MVERAPMADADALHRHAAQHHCIERRALGLAADALAAGTLVRVFEEPKPFGFELNVIRSRSRYLPPLLTTQP